MCLIFIVNKMKPLSFFFRVLLIFIFLTIYVGKAQLDTNQYKIFKFNPKEKFIFDKSFKPTELNKENIEEIYKLLGPAIENYILDEIDVFKKLNPGKSYNIENIKIQWEKYKYQFIPVINKKGELIVWCNAICNGRDFNWKNSIIIVHDGGKCFFNLKINLTKHKAFELLVNGLS